MFALQTPGIRNASMAFEDAENRPLFKLLLGVAGRSRGIETARRCGFDREILERAEAFLGEEASRFERLISELELSHIALEREREALSRQSESLRRVIERYAEKEREFDSSKAEQSEKARAEAEAILVDTRREIERIVKEIRESGAKKEQIRRGQERIRDLQRDLQRRERPRRTVSVSVGDAVSLNPSGIPRGTVIEVDEDSAAVEIGGKRIKTKMENLYKLDRPPESSSSGVSWNVSFEPLTSTDLDVRGQDREEALQEVDRFIDRAILSGVHEVRIIHGVGEGILLRAIQSFLLEDRRVKSMRTGSPGEGGLGVSIIQLS
jgi:DNA mismatch repair protein MutS2